MIAFTKASQVMASKTCFIIAPIGADGSQTRRRSDQLCRHVLKPVLENCGYTSIQRADEVTTPGLIGAQIIRSLTTAELVIADLTDHNPNVFYELAVRHTTTKPAVQVIEYDKPLPFDVAQLRTIKYNLNDPDAIEQCKTELKGQVEHAERNPFTDNPVRSYLQPASVRSHSYLLLIGPPEAWRELDLSRVEWIPEDCVVTYGEANSERIRVVPSGIGPSFQVILPDGIFDRVEATQTLELRLRDSKGNDWRVQPFFPFRKLLPVTPLAPRAKLIADYGDDEA
jgi:hypothetical protein